MSEPAPLQPDSWNHQQNVVAPWMEPFEPLFAHTGSLSAPSVLMTRPLFWATMFWKSGWPKSTVPPKKVWKYSMSR